MTYGVIRSVQGKSKVSQRESLADFTFAALWWRYAIAAPQNITRIERYADLNQVCQRKESTSAYRDSNGERGNSPFLLLAIIIVLCAKKLPKAYAEKQDCKSFLKAKQACYYDTRRTRQGHRHLRFYKATH